MDTCKQIIIQYAEKQKSFSTNDLLYSLSKLYKWSYSTIKCNMTKLLDEGVLSKISKGVYCLTTSKNIFKIIPNKTDKNIFSLLTKKFPFASFCVYNGRVLSALQHHLSENNITYVETNKEAVESVFGFLKDNGFTVYQSPNSDFVYRYIDLKNEAIIVKPLVSESPMKNIDGVNVPTIEKILVDIQKDDDFSYLQGSESENMLENAQTLFHINLSKLVRYGKRRGLTIKMEQND